MVLTLSLLGGSPASATQPSIGLAPVQNSPLATGTSVTVSWVDKSVHEDAFVVLRRGTDGQLWNIADIATTSSSGVGARRSWVDTTPNVLKCYQVWAYDYNTIYDIVMSADLCVGGGLDPFDPAIHSTVQNMAAPSLDSVQVAGTSVTLHWTDRAINEDAVQIFRHAANAPTLTMLTDMQSVDKPGVGHTYTFVDTIAAGTKQCYLVTDYDNAGSGLNISNEICTAPVAALPAPAAKSGTIYGLDTAGSDTKAAISGVYSSVAIGTDNLGLISYYMGGTSASGTMRLRVGHCVDTNCSNVTTTDIDNGPDVGQFSSIKIGSDGLGVISYLSYRSSDFTTFTEDLKVAHCNNVACTSATVTTLDKPSLVDAKTSITIGPDGFASIAYQDDTAPSTKIKVAHCQNLACTSATINTVDTVHGNGGNFGGGGGGVSIATSPNGVEYIDYVDGDPKGGLRVASCFVATCASAQVYAVDTGDLGGWPSISIARDGYPLLSYVSNYTTGNPYSGSDLVVSHCVNIWCSGITTRDIDTDGYTGWQGSIATGSDGFGVISYFDESNSNLKLAHCTDVICTNATTVLLDEFDDTGRQSAITIGHDGLPLITYLGTSEGHLKAVHCPNAACTGQLVVPF